MSANPESESFSDFPDDAPAPGGTRGSLEGRLVRRLLSGLGDPPLEFVLWSGERIAPAGAAPVIKIRIRDRATLFRILSNPQVQFGDAYSAGTVEVEGDLVHLIELIYRGMGAEDGRQSFTDRIARWFRRNTLAGSRRNIHHHYDIGNEFYAMWLGETMAYTCAYYPTAEATLEQAQIAKMDHVCRKLRLKPGIRWSRRAVAGAAWRCTWPADMGRGYAHSTSRASR